MFSGWLRCVGLMFRADVDVWCFCYILLYILYKLYIIYYTYTTISYLILYSPIFSIPFPIFYTSLPFITLLFSSIIPPHLSIILPSFLHTLFSSSDLSFQYSHPHSKYTCRHLDILIYTLPPILLPSQYPLQSSPDPLSSSFSLL